eukprot:2184317-Lingulodinium_polyedra.AAC.1
MPSRKSLAPGPAGSLWPAGGLAAGRCLSQHRGHRWCRAAATTSGRAPWRCSMRARTFGSGWL